MTSELRSVARTDCPADLQGDQSTGGRELGRVLAFFSEPNNSQKAYKNYRAYKQESVVSALEAMFLGKCAYCEARYDHIGPPVVEHYRPKGAYLDEHGNLIKPGYYWLAADWENLLISCVDCNSARNHLEDGEPVLLGKANQFPLVDERQRAQAPGEEKDEEPLLLDPTRDRVEEHLEFVDGGVVRPALLNGSESDRGKTTIDVVGLRRRRLIGHRLARLDVVDGHIARYKVAVAGLDCDPSNDYLAFLVESELAELRRMLQPDAEYTLMVKQRIELHCPELFCG